MKEKKKGFRMRKLRDFRRSGKMFEFEAPLAFALIRFSLLRTTCR